MNKGEITEKFWNFKSRFSFLRKSEKIEESVIKIRNKD